MAGTNILKIIVTGDVAGGKKALSDIGGSADKSGGQLANFGALGSVGIGAVAGAAVAFGVKSIQAFDEAGAATRKFQITAGGTAESVSGLLAASNMLGVSSDDLTAATAKLTIAEGAHKDIMSALGVQTVDNNGKARDQTAILQDTLVALSNEQDVTKRNTEAKALFGKAYTNILPLIAQSGKLTEAESQAKKDGLVLTQSQVDAAHKNEEAMRQMNAAVKGVEVELGSALVPALTSTIERMTSMLQVTNELSHVSVPGLGGSFGDLIKQSAEMAPVIGQAISAQDTLDKAHKSGKKSTDAAADATKAESKAQADAKTATDAFAEAQKEATKAVDDWIKAQQAAVDPTFAVARADTALKDAKLKVLQAIHDYGLNSPQAVQANLDMAKSAMDLEGAQAHLTDQMKQGPAALEKQRAALENLVTTGAITRAQADAIATSMYGIAAGAQSASDKLSALNGKHVSVYVDLGGNFADLQGFVNQGGGKQARAAGGPVRAGQPYIVGENHVGGKGELFVPDQSGYIVPHAQTQQMLGSGGGSDMLHATINIDGRKVAEAIVPAVRKNEMAHA